MKSVNDSPTLTDLIDDNLSSVDAPEAVDQINGTFYKRFPFPRRPKAFACTSDLDN
jgi:hypothetical protein